MLRLVVHTGSPQKRHVERAVEILGRGGVGIFPTDSTYGLGCDLAARKAVDRVRRIKGLDARHPLSFVCSDLSQAAQYAVIENANFRLLKRHLPGSYTFILPAASSVPRVVQSNVRTVGIRIPSSPVMLALVAELRRPVVTTTVLEKGATHARPVGDPEDILRWYGRDVDVFLDGGELFGDPSSVVDLTGPDPVVVRRGAGDTNVFEP